MKYIAYYRTSTKEQRLGIGAQASSVHQFVNTEQGAELIAEYQEQESGKNDHRPELKKALAHCKRENAVLLLAKLDRLSRKVSFIFALREASVKFRALDLPEINDVLTLSIYAGLAEQERSLISDRTKKALAKKREELKAQGKKLGKPNGFTKAELEKAAAAHKAAAAQNTNNRQSKAMAVNLQSKGYTIPEIVKELNANGYKTARGCQHSYMTVKRLLG